MRAQILQSTVIGSVKLVNVILLMTWVSCVWCSSKKATKKGLDASKAIEPVVADEAGHLESGSTDMDTAQSNASGSCWCRFWSQAKQSPYKQAGYGILAWAVVKGIAAGIVLIGLKSCWF